MMELQSMSSLSSVVRPSLAQSTRAWQSNQSIVSTSRGYLKDNKRRGFMVVAKRGLRGATPRGPRGPGQYRQEPTLPKIEDDGDPKFVIFIRNAQVNNWYPLSLISGGSTAKLVVAAKDNFIGKYLYKDVLARNIGSVIYKDEKVIKKTVAEKYTLLKGVKEFRYGYKLVIGTDVKTALTKNDVVEIPTKEELKTVLDKARDFFKEAVNGAKESFGKLASIGSIENEP